MSYLCDRVCENKTEYGYCKTAYCIYPEFPHRAVLYTSAKPKTNADRIRNMSDKDLADLLSGGEPYPWCEQDPCPAETCQECILMWLKQEAKHDL